MAKKSVIARNVKRKKLVEKYAQKRQALKVQARSLDDEVRMQAIEKLQKLPRNASPTRLRNRCQETGRPRGVYRRFGVSRHVLREMGMMGEVPGLSKSSW